MQRSWGEKEHQRPIEGHWAECGEEGGQGGDQEQPDLAGPSLPWWTGLFTRGSLISMEGY